MGLIGSCKICGTTANLRYYPGSGPDEDRPSLCPDCYHDIEIRIEEERERPVPPHVPPTPDDWDETESEEDE